MTAGAALGAALRAPLGAGRNRHGWGPLARGLEQAVLLVLGRQALVLPCLGPLRQFDNLHGVLAEPAPAADAEAEELTERREVLPDPAVTQAALVEDGLAGIDVVGRERLHIVDAPPREELAPPGQPLRVPGQVELEPSLLAHAKVVADRLPQCAKQAEIHHALQASVISEADIHAELGDVVTGAKPGREADHEIMIADLTGVGVLEAALAELVTSRALERGRGRVIRDG